MRVGRFASFGDPSVLEVAEQAAPPSPRGDRVQVRVHASSVNGTDLGLRRGDLKPVTWGRMPFVPGFDLAGEVVACGPRVTSFSVGDRVMALLGHRVLVLGSSGGIGSYAVQLARLAGAHVTGTASGPKLDHVLALGAHEALDRRSSAPRAAGAPFDVVLDAAGHATLAATRPLVAAGGIMVSVRPLHPDTLRAALRRPGGPRYGAVRTQARPGDLAHLADLVVRGVLRVPIDRVVALDDVAAAHRHAETDARGKVVVSLVPGAG